MARVHRTEYQRRETYTKRELWRPSEGPHDVFSRVCSVCGYVCVYTVESEEIAILRNYRGKCYSTHTKPGLVLIATSQTRKIS